MLLVINRTRVAVKLLDVLPHLMSKPDDFELFFLPKQSSSVTRHDLPLPHLAHTHPTGAVEPNHVILRRFSDYAQLGFFVFVFLFNESEGDVGIPT